ncbi:MAG: hypothetical protein QOD07_819 [Frankiaceae bacterium]|jgi:hypothetical protein|nr:hypothetical protein [Frankiaceae bacterium]
MSSYDEPTQQVRRSDPPPAPLPGSLDPLRGYPGESGEVETGTGWVDTHPADEAYAPVAEPPITGSPITGSPVAEPAPTGVLPIDQIFESPEPQPVPTAAADAPTWTAMPVVPVRSEPLPGPQPTALGQPYGHAYGHPYEADATRQPAREPAWSGAQSRVEDWLRRDDNGLMLLTALVACVLMIVVAGVGN